MTIKGFLEVFGTTPGSAAHQLLLFFDVVVYFVALNPLVQVVTEPNHIPVVSNLALLHSVVSNETSHALSPPRQYREEMP